MLEASEGARILGAASRFSHVCIAFSGGADSTALVLLAAASGLSTRFTALIVDHGLRPESASEAEAARAFAEALGIPARVLGWTGEKPATGIQAAAREARYRLMAQEARCIGGQAILTAHQLDDVAETFLMRLARGSGLDGLAGIPAESVIEGIPVLRPLLAHTHEELAHFCRSQGASWIEDPSNRSSRFERARLRQAMGPALAALGLDKAKIGLSAQRLARAREALDAETGRFLEEHMALEEGGVRVGLGAFAAASAEIRVRALARLLPEAELAQAERLADWLAAGEGTAMTLSGQLIRREENSFIIRPEAPRKKAL